MSLPRNSANKQERSLELVFILAQITMITFNIKCFRQLYQEYQRNPGCYIEFGLMANSVKLTRARVNFGNFHQYDLTWGRNGYKREMVSQGHHLKKTKLGQSRTNKYYCQNASCYKTCGNHINSNWHACNW